MRWQQAEVVALRFFEFSQLEVSSSQVIVSLAVTRIPFQHPGKMLDCRLVLQTFESDQSQTKMRLGKEPIFAKRSFVCLTRFFRLSELLVRHPFLKGLFGAQSFN